MSEEENAEGKGNGGQSKEGPQIRDRLNLFLRLTGAGVIVGLVGFAVLDFLGDARTLIFFIPVIPAITGLACALLVRTNTSGGNYSASNLAARMTTILTWSTGCALALALAMLVLFVFFVALIESLGLN